MPKDKVETFKPERTTRINLTEDQAKQFSVGADVSVTVSGKVKNVGVDFDKEFSVTLSSPKASGIKGNSADSELKRLSKKET
jgi:hypothetical protein